MAGRNLCSPSSMNNQIFPFSLDKSNLINEKRAHSLLPNVPLPTMNLKFNCPSMEHPNIEILKNLLLKEDGLSYYLIHIEGCGTILSGKEHLYKTLTIEWLREFIIPALLDVQFVSNSIPFRKAIKPARLM